jgi:hypothetical protein
MGDILCPTSSVDASGCQTQMKAGWMSDTNEGWMHAALWSPNVILFSPPNSHFLSPTFPIRAISEIDFDICALHIAEWVTFST